MVTVCVNVCVCVQKCQVCIQAKYPLKVQYYTYFRCPYGHLYQWVAAVLVLGGFTIGGGLPDCLFLQQSFSVSVLIFLSSLGIVMVTGICWAGLHCFIVAFVVNTVCVSGPKSRAIHYIQKRHIQFIVAQLVFVFFVCFAEAQRDLLFGQPSTLQRTSLLCHWSQEDGNSCECCLSVYMHSWSQLASQPQPQFVLVVTMPYLCVCGLKLVVMQLSVHVCARVYNIPWSSCKFTCL